MSCKREIEAALALRFGETLDAPAEMSEWPELAKMAERGVCRHFSERPVDAASVRILAACGLSAPSKSDLQQRDIIVVTDPGLRSGFGDLLPHMPWVRLAPAFLVVCLNGARIPAIAELREKPFPNDHLDLFFNAAADAAITLATCLHAAEAVGMGGCPISEIRDHAEQVGLMLGLPDRVIPFAGLCLGWPAKPPQITPRLPLGLTLHENRYRHVDFPTSIDAYDMRREEIAPFASQRDVARWGASSGYGWSEDKARQYAVSRRADFGAYVRRHGFNLD